MTQAHEAVENRLIAAALRAVLRRQVHKNSNPIRRVVNQKYVHVELEYSTK